jgi:hypothetical protein
MSEDLDFDSRRLCSDDACIGVLDDAGVCKECGKRGGEAVTPSAVKAADPPPARSIDVVAEESADDSDDRELCSDGGCIGLIGPNGRCKVCGTPRGS